MPSTWVKLMPVVMGASLLAACAGFNEHRGYIMDEELATAIQVGVDNKQSVTQALGRPTFTGQFNENDWYYLSRDTKIVPFRSAKVKEQELLHIQFDSAGNVAAINRGDETAIVSINPVNDKTPTLGRERGFFDELFGNIGVFNSGAMAPQPGQ